MLLLLAACDGDPVSRPRGHSTSTSTTDTTAIRYDLVDNGFTLWCDDERVLVVTTFADGVVRFGRSIPPESFAVSEPGSPPDAPSIVPYSDLVAMRTDTVSLLVRPEGGCTAEITDLEGTPLAELAFASYGDFTAGIVEGEHIYGLGERTGGLDRVGGTYDCWNTDAYDAAEGGWGPDADPLYQCVPFYVSKRGPVASGVFLDMPERSTWDVGATDPAALTVDGDAWSYTAYFVAGPSFADVLERYTGLTGRPPLPPRWALGFHQSRWGWADADEVRSVVAAFRAEDLPLDAVWLDVQHLDGFRSWTWDPTTYGDPARLVADLDAEGVRAVSIVDPAIKVDPDWAVYADGVKAGYFLEEDGEPWVGTVWPGDSVFPDFADEAVRDWWGGLAATDVGYGIAGFWLDMNEPSEFTEGTVPDDLGAGEDTMARVHNVYALLEAQATWEGVSAAAPDQRPFLLTRAGYAGIQRYAAAWTGDAPSTWASLSGTLPMLLGMGLSGEAFVGSDVGGYSGNATGELYTRWMGVGAFSPFFRAHLTQGMPDQYPWSFGTEVLDISRSYLELRSSLVAYFYSLAWEASRTGAPPLRPLVWAFPDDPAVEDLGDEALLGDHVLIAPVLEEGATSREVYLPEGRWFEWNTGIAWDGPTTLTREELPLAALPIFVREGAILPIGDVLPYADATTDGLTLSVWPGEAATSFTVYEDAGDGHGEYAATTWTLQGTASGATLSSTREGSLTFDRLLGVRVRRVDSAPTEVRLDGVALPEAEARPDTSGWWWDPVDLSLWVVFPDAATLTVEMDYDPTLVDFAPPVDMPFRVTVPEGTPQDTPIAIASSADDWATFTPLAWVSATVAEGTLQVPRGEYVYYKYTRGGWETVEKWPDCAEAANRYELGSAVVKEDTVWAWRDQCE